MHDHTDKAASFLALHRQERPLLLANAWDVGSAKLLASLGFQALASTSSGYAASLGRLDYGVSREEALAHAAALVAATDVPVSADFEDGFAADAAGVAETVRPRARGGARGLLGRGLERREQRLYDVEVAAERVAAAAQAAHAGPVRARAHGARREPPARQPRRARHDRASAGLPGGRRGRALRTAARSPGGSPLAARVRRSARQRARASRTRRRWRSWRRWASSACRSAAASRSPPTVRPSRWRASC